MIKATKTRRPANLFAGYDNPLINKRKVFPSIDDIKRACRFFSIGKLINSEKEKGIDHSHSNVFVFVETSHGQYALKFYPAHEARIIIQEYAVNSLLIKHHFLTPPMHAGTNGQPFLNCHQQLAACYSYIDGQAPWHDIRQEDTIHQINSRLLALKKILSSAQINTTLLKQPPLTKTVSVLLKASRAMSPYNDQATIEASLADAFRSYQQHRHLFTRQWIHNNTTLPNFLISKKKIYVLDLNHVQEDYTLNDLQKIIVSCLSFNTPLKTVKTIADDYFEQHKLGPEYFHALNALIKISLVKIYLEKIEREKTFSHSAYPAEIVKEFMTLTSASKKYLVGQLVKLNKPPLSSKLAYPSGKSKA